MDERRLRCYRAVDKLDRLGAKAVLELLTVGRKDASGDFTKGAGLDLRTACFVLDCMGIATQVICHRPEIGFAMVYVDG